MIWSDLRCTRRYVCCAGISDKVVIRVFQGCADDSRGLQIRSGFDYISKGQTIQLGNRTNAGCEKGMSERESEKEYEEQCGVLNKDGPHRLICLGSSIMSCGIVEGTVSWGWTLAFLMFKPDPVVLFLPAAYRSRCRTLLLAASSVPCLPVCCHGSHHDESGINLCIYKPAPIDSVTRVAVVMVSLYSNRTLIKTDNNYRGIKFEKESMEFLLILQLGLSFF